MNVPLDDLKAKFASLSTDDLLIIFSEYELGSI